MGNLLSVVDKIDIGQIYSSKGAILNTSEGQYVDMFADNGAVSLGYDYKSDTLPHLSQLFNYDVRQIAAKRLCQASNMSKAFFCNSSSEAVEAMIRFAREYQATRHKIYTLKGAFHKKDGAYGVRSFETFEDIDEDAAAVILTPARLHGDFQPYEKEWFENLLDYCDGNGILLCFDEVQTYLRLGRWWGYQIYNREIKPDMIATAKGVAGGISAGVTLVKDKIAKSIPKNSHFLTFSDNSASYEGILDVLEQAEDLMILAKTKGDYIKKALGSHPKVNNIRGQGLMIAFDYVGNSLKLKEECLEKHVILGVFSEEQPIKLTPALTISMSALRYALEMIKQCL